MAPTIAELKRIVRDPAQSIEVRKVALLGVTSRTSKKVEWLRSVEDSDQYPAEIRELASATIAGVKVLRGARAKLRRHGLL